jgi:hypothetical protein
MTRDELIETAIGVNENYRVNKFDKELETGFLYGTAELIVALTIQKNESYSELRGQIARQIDAKAAKNSYRVLNEK